MGKDVGVGKEAGKGSLARKVKQGGEGIGTAALQREPRKAIQASGKAGSAVDHPRMGSS